MSGIIVGDIADINAGAIADVTVSSPVESAVSLPGRGLTILPILTVEILHLLVGTTWHRFRKINFSYIFKQYILIYINFLYETEFL